MQNALEDMSAACDSFASLSCGNKKRHDGDDAAFCEGRLDARAAGQTAVSFLRLICLLGCAELCEEIWFNGLKGGGRQLSIVSSVHPAFVPEAITAAVEDMTASFQMTSSMGAGFFCLDCSRDGRLGTSILNSFE